MKREAKYIVVLLVLLALFILVQLYGPKALDWTPTFLATDKNPFGAFVSAELLKPFFGGKKIETNNLTLYELQDSIGESDNVISMSNGFRPDDAEVKVLLNKVDSGCHAFISAFYFRGKFADTLGLNTTDVFFGGLVPPQGLVRDTTDLKLVIPGTEKRGYYYKLENVSYYFSAPDSIKRDSYIISTNAWGKPVTIRIPWGKGFFILNTTPLAFTNNYLLYEDNHQYASQTFSFLPSERTWWTSYYQVGRLEAMTPLRYILKTEPLLWAYYIMMGALVLFLIFESKRKQRIIPIIKPFTNTTLEFVKTIGNMYLHANDHKAIAEKKIAFFLDKVRSNYFLSTESGDAMIETLAKKSGNSLEKTQKLFTLIRIIQGSASISEEMLMDLNNQVEEFIPSRNFASLTSRNPQI